jgi:hypothetical protein
MFEINESIELDPVNVSLFDSNKEEIGETAGIIEMSFLPKFRAIIKGEIEHGEAIFFKKITDIKYIKVNNSEKLIEVIPLNIQLSGSAKFRLIPTDSSFFIGSDSKVQKIKFFITNFDCILQKETLEIGDWEIDLRLVTKNDEFKELKKTGGYLITHEGTISRKDDESFKKHDLNDLMVFLYLLFTFANGFDTCPFYLRGINKKGDLIWYQVSNNKLDSYTKVNNWFDLPNTDLVHFSNGFYNFFKDDIYKEYIREIIYWYVHSNEGGNDKSVILSHTCLELISWLYLTLDKKNLSKNGFNNLYASDSFSLTLTSCNIPIEIPKKLEGLKKLAKGDQNIENSCQVFSLIRNKIVHPSSNRRKNITKSRHLFEAKLLGCKFIELFILYKSNYHGSYFNRINYNTWKGNVEKVPWA